MITRKEIIKLTKPVITIFLSYFNAVLAYFNDEEEKPEYKNCYIAMEQTKAYLEILGFQCVN